jgi:DNA-binding response OmpR family regulator
MDKILIVDDEAAILMLYDDELTEEGYDVTTCSDGSQTLGLIRKSEPDIVLLDIMLGDDNGLDLLQEIRNTYYDLPVILCSSYPAFKYDMKSIAADYYVVKSPNLAEMKAKIKMALEGGRPMPTGDNKGISLWEKERFLQ